MQSIAQMLCFLTALILTVSALTVIILWKYNLPLIYGVGAPVITFLLCYFSLPVLFILSGNVRRYFVYLARTKKPPKEFDFADVASAGLSGCRNFYLFLEGHERIGVWHLLPHSLIEESTTQHDIEKYWHDSLRTSGKHIIIYFHGNTGTRALDHRKELYWLLQNADCHIIAFDYRGFADSTSVATSEQTTVDDGMLVYNWVKKVIGHNSAAKIYIWGHSLGTGICSHVVAHLTENDSPAGLILESPFTNIGEAMQHNKKTIFYRCLPKFKPIFVHTLHKNGIAYETDNHIERILIPILILHAMDDETIPFFLGEKLFCHAKSTRPIDAHPIHLKSFPGGYGYGHKLIYTAPEMPKMIDSFIEATISGDWTSFTYEYGSFMSY